MKKNVLDPKGLQNPQKVSDFESITIYNLNYPQKC